MTVAHMWSITRIVECDTSQDQSSTKHIAKSQAYLDLIRIAALCIEPNFKPDSGGVHSNRFECPVVDNFTWLEYTFYNLSYLQNDVPVLKTRMHR